MKKFTFENQGINTYMVYQVGVDEEIDSMSLGMITNNKILGLAPTIFMQQDNTKYFKYNVSSKVSADQFLMGTVNKKRIIGVFSGIVNAMISAEEYMIDTNSICLELDSIFTDVTTCETTLICLPIINIENTQSDLKTFFKNIVFSTQFDQTENCDYIPKLINYLNSASVFSIYDFKELLDSITREGTQPVQQQAVNVAQNSVQKENIEATSQPVVTTQPVVKQQTVPQPVVTPQPVVASQPVVAPQPAPVQQSVPVTQTTQPSPQKDLGFAVSGGNRKAEESVVETAAPEKEVSLMYLIRHYDKETAAAYKAQQDAKKAAKAAAAPAKKDKKESKAKTKEVPNSAQGANLGFAIPGQQAAPIANTSGSVAPAPQPAPVPQQQVVPQPAPAAQQPVVPQPAPVTQQPVVPQPVPTPQPVTPPVNFGETTVLSSSTIGETTVLGASPVMQEIKPYLVRTKNNEKVILDKPVFRIGKEKSYVDYFIGDNTAISRSHANIITRDGEYFVMDTNSTNHTYLNGAMLQSNVETKIAHGAKIRFANEDFEFKLY